MVLEGLCHSPCSFFHPVCIGLSLHGSCSDSPVLSGLVSVSAIHYISKAHSEFGFGNEYNLLKTNSAEEI